MYFKLALQNLRYRPERTALTLLGVIISLFFFLFINALVSGIHNFLFKNILDQNPLTQLVVRPEGQGKLLNPVNLLKKSEITLENIQAIEKIPHVQTVHKLNSLAGISSLQVSLFGQWFQTDSLIFGAPLEYLKSTTINENNWTVPEDIIENQTVIPAIGSTELLDLYNFSFASANNLPKLSPENLIGQEVLILVNKSTFFNQTDGASPTIKAKVIGFSPKAKLIGLTIPSQAVDQINKKFLNATKPHYTDLIVNVDSLENLSSVQTEIKKLDLSATNSSQSLERLNSQFLFIQIAINLINLVILIVCGLMIANTFLTRLIESTKQIGILRALGFSKKQIGNLFLLEAGIIGFISSLTACLLVIPATSIVNAFLQNQLNDFSNKPNNFFELSPLLIVGSIIFGILFCLIFSYFPSQKAARLHPVEALSK